MNKLKSKKSSIKLTIKKLLSFFNYRFYKKTIANSSDLQLLKLIDSLSINKVFDIGANEGQFGQSIRKGGYKGQIVSFEPQSDAWIELKKNANNDSNWLIHERVAIGNSNGEIKINISNNSVSSSVLPMLKQHSSAASDSVYIAEETVPIVTFDSIASQYLNNESNIFLKIDTQGFEWEVLEGAKDTLNFVNGVIVELSLVPLYDGQRLWKDIINKLENEGFTLWALQEVFTDPNTGQSHQFDGIYIKNRFI
jgi:FkbM family methyltransferase